MKDTLGNDVDENSLLNHGYELFRVASTARQQRAALIIWLRGAVFSAQHSTDHHAAGSAPGEFLASALEALDLGTTMPFLKPENRPRHLVLQGARARAKARAVAAIFFFEKLGVRPGQAAALVAELNGMTKGSLESLRAHVKAGTAYVEVRQHLDECCAEIDEMVQHSKLLSGDPTGQINVFTHLLVSRLFEDRPYLKSFI